MRFFIFSAFFTFLALPVQSQDKASNSDSVIEIQEQLSQSEQVPLGSSVEQIPENLDSIVKVESSSGSGELEIIETEEELILDGGEEDLLAPARVDKAKKAAEKVQEKPVQNIESEGQKVPAIAMDSTQKAAPLSRGKPVIPSLKISEPASKPVIIEQAKSINFARNLNEYRSPKVAIMLSLLFPGAGQAYARNGLKSGVFGAVEVAIVGVGVSLGVMGRNDKRAAFEFADQHFSVDRFDVYYEKLKNHLSDTVLNELFLSSEVDTFRVYATDQNDDYYRIIREKDNPYVHGWDDAEPNFSSNFEIENDEYIRHGHQDSSYLVYRKGSDESEAQFGFSENQEKFDEKVSKSNSYFRASKGVLTLLLVNHIASAVDAGITAKAYNDHLLGKESFWQRINIEQKNVKTGHGTANGYALQVRF